MRDRDRTLRVILRAVWVGIVLLVAATPSVTSQSSGPTSVQFGKNIRLTVNLDQEETAIAANPLNAANLVAVSQGPLGRPTPRACDFVFTTNGGKSWMFGGSAPLERSGDTCADPAIAADGQGNFYFAHLDFLISGGVVTESDVLVAKSTDGGQTFPAFTVAVNQDPKDPRSPDPDKEFVAVDTGTASAFRGTIYVAYTDLGNIQGDQIEAVISRDGGATWSLPAVIAAPAANEKAAVTRAGTLPVVAADGTVYVFYAEFPFLGVGPMSIRFSKSTNGGVTWSPPADVAAGLPSAGSFALKNSDPGFGTTVGAGLSSNSFPTAAVAPDGTLYVAWADFPHGSCVADNSDRPPCINADVRLSVSRDGGATWTPPVKATDEINPTDQFFPWIAVHPNGLLSMAWRDKRLDPNNVNIDTFYTNTPDGATFLPNVRVSSVASPNTPGFFLGDYQGLAVTADGIFPVWTDTRSGDEDVFTSVGRLLH